jgi:hypothetical protein
MAYIYRHIRLDKNQPFYIGVGGLDEFDNYERAFDKNGRNVIWKYIIRKSKYEVEILVDNLSREEAFSKEIEFIKLYGRIDKQTGILSNLTDGGEGGKSRIVPESVKEYLRNLYKGKPRPEHVKKAMNRKGCKHSEESKKRIGNSVKGEKNGFYGKNHNRNSIERMKKNAHIMIGTKNPFYSKTHSEENLEKMSKTILNIETGIFYTGVIEASFVSNIKYSYLRGMLNGNSKNKTSFISC